MQNRGTVVVGPITFEDTSPDAGIVLQRGKRYLGGSNPRWELMRRLACRVNEGLVALADALTIADGIDTGTVMALPALN